MHASSRRTAPLLEWAARIGAVTAEAVAHRWELPLSSARARLSAGERKGLLVRRRPLVGEPALYVLTRAGRRAAGAPIEDSCRVGASNAAHLIACAAAAAMLERCYPRYTALGERELRRQAPAERGSIACVRLGRDRRGRPMLHRPDLLLLQAQRDERPVAVEVELTVKSPRRLEEICRAWARSRELAGVLYLAAPCVERPLQRAIARADAEGNVVVLPLEVLSCSR